MKYSLDVVVAALLLAVFLNGCGDSDETEEANSALTCGDAVPESAGGESNLVASAPGGEVTALRASDGEAEQWLDLGQIAPHPLAIQPQGQRALVAVGAWLSPYLSILYDLDSHEELRTWDHGFTSARFSSDGSRFVTADTDVVVWDADRGDEIRRIEGCRPVMDDAGYYASKTNVLLNENGTLVAISNTRGAFDRRLPHSVLLFDLQSGRLPKSLINGFSMEVRPLAFADGGTRLLTQSSQWRPEGRNFARPGIVSVVALWDTQNGDLLCEFPDEATAVVSRDGRWIAAGCRPPHLLVPGTDTGTLSIWDARTGELVLTRRLEHALRDFAFSPDGRRVLAATHIGGKERRATRFAGRLMEWDWRSGKALFEKSCELLYARVMYSPDGRQRFVLTEEVNQLDDNVYCLGGWNVETGEELLIAEYEVFCNSVHELYFFPKGDRFVKLGWDGYGERNVLSGEVVRELPSHRCAGRSASFAPDGERILIQVDYPGTSGMLDLSSGEQWVWGLSYRTREQFVADGRLVFAYAGKHVYLVDPVSDTVVWQFPFELSVTDVAISPDARHVAVASGTVSRYSTPKPPRVVLIDPLAPLGIRFLERTALALAYHPEGQRFVEASPDSVHECDGTSGDRIRSLFDVPGRALDVCYGPEGKQILACGVVGHVDPREAFEAEDEGWVMLWDEGREEAIRLEGHTAPVVSADFSPDGSRCATGSLDRTICLWDTSSGELLHTFRGHLGEVRTISYSPKGDRILSAGQDGAAIWNVSQYAPVPVESTPLAEEFELSSRPYAASSGAVMRGEESPVSHILSEYLSASDSDPKREEWTAILFGRGTFRDLQKDMIHVLSKPARTVHSTVPLPPSKPQRFSHRWDLVDTAEGGNRRLFFRSHEKKVYLTDKNDEILREWSAPKPTTRGALSPDGDEVVIAHEEQPESGGHGYRISFHDATSGSLLQEFTYEDDQRIGWIDVGPKSETILLRMVKSKVVLLDYRSGEMLGHISTPSIVGPDVQYSPDGRFIAVQFFREVTLYDRATLAEVKTLVHPLLVQWCRFSPDGKRLLAGQVSEILTMWDVDSGRQLWTRQGYASENTVFSGDGQRFLSRWKSGPAFLWDAVEGKLVAVAIGPTGLLALGTDGRSLHLSAPTGPTIWFEN